MIMMSVLKRPSIPMMTARDFPGLVDVMIFCAFAANPLPISSVLKKIVYPPTVSDTYKGRAKYDQLHCS